MSIHPLSFARAIDPLHQAKIHLAAAHRLAVLHEKAKAQADLELDKARAELDRPALDPLKAISAVTRMASESPTGSADITDTQAKGNPPTDGESSKPV